MKKKAGIITAVVILAVILLWALWPRSFEDAMTFQSAMPDGFDSEEMLGVGVLLMSHTGDQDVLQYDIPADDPAYEELMDLLDSKNYYPLLPTADDQGLYVTLEYTVLLAFYDDSADYCLRFTGDEPMNFYNHTADQFFRTSDSEAFQQEILDLLLVHLPSEQQPQE